MARSTRKKGARAEIATGSHKRVSTTSESRGTATATKRVREVTQNIDTKDCNYSKEKVCTSHRGKGNH